MKAELDALTCKAGVEIIESRLVDVNKGDVEHSNCRSLLVGREFSIGKDDTLYMATPPLESLRYMVSYAATWRFGEGSARRGITITDVRRACFYAKPTRDLYIELPAEDPDAGKGMLGKLELCVYGTRDAAKGWQESFSPQLELC